MALAIWQVIVWSGWRPTYIFPGPGEVFSELWSKITDGTLAEAAATTLRRAATGYTFALVVGTLLGAAVASSKVLRTAVASLITGLQTMPSIAWFPLAILLYGLSEAAILFVVVIGAAPSIANGLIAGVDLIPPLQMRAARVLGARRLALWRHVVLPAALPSYLARAEAGVGIRLAQPDGGRAPRDHRPPQVHRRRAPDGTGVLRCPGADGHHDRDPGHRDPRGLAAVRDGRASGPPAMGPDRAVLSRDGGLSRCRVAPARTSADRRYPWLTASAMICWATSPSRREPVGDVGVPRRTMPSVTPFRSTAPPGWPC